MENRQRRRPLPAGHRWAPGETTPFRSLIWSCTREVRAHECRKFETVTNESTEATSIPTPPSSAIVFGGAGFIGTRLLNLLRDRGTERLVSADFKPARGERAAGVEYIPVDVRRPIGIDEDFDVIYNFAAIHTTPGHEPHEYYEANIGGALNVTQLRPSSRHQDDRVHQLHLGLRPQRGADGRDQRADADQRLRQVEVLRRADPPHVAA